MIATSVLGGSFNDVSPVMLTYHDQSPACAPVLASVCVCVCVCVCARARLCACVERERISSVDNFHAGLKVSSQI